MKAWLFVGSIVVLYSFQTTLFSSLSISGVRPDLVLIFLCAVALSQGWWTGSVVGFVAGFIADIVEGHFIGLGAISKAMAGGSIGWAGQNLFGENVIVPILVVLCGSVIRS